MIKNQASLLTFPMYDEATGDLLAGLSPSATISIDGSAFAATDNSVESVGGGHYKLQLSQAEMDGDSVTVEVVATGALAVTFDIDTSSPWDESSAEHKDGGTFGQLVDHKISTAGAHPAKA